MTRIVDARTAREGYVTLHVLTLADDAGAPFRREVVSFGDSVCVLPYDPFRKTAVVVRVQRAPVIWRGVETPLVEAPAGMIDAGETPDETVRREAMEEAGLALRTLEPVAACWPSPGVLAERSHLFLAPYSKSDRTGPGGGLAGEHVVVFETALAELAQLAERGELADMKTFALVMALRARRPELF
jgi:nudix-type nucleoside diphosphatase (YffH/AdpP family)